VNFRLPKPKRSQSHQAPIVSHGGAIVTRSTNISDRTVGTNLAAAVSMDEVKKFHNQSLAMKVYAYQARDAELLSFAVEMRRRAKRRLGELIKSGPRAKPPGVAKDRVKKTRSS
jgi:hypothetical protein